MNNWKRTVLSEVAEVRLSNVDKKFYDEEIEVRLCNYMDVYKNAYINSNIAKSFMVASCKQNELDNFKLKEGQVAITKDSETRDDIGISTYISESFQDVVLGYHTSLITPNKKLLNGKFLNYWFKTKQAKVYFENNAGGSGQRCTLPIDIIKSISLNLPSIELQEQIASIFYNLDSKIELNNRINVELEAMAKTLYDYWFVQFDFPDANGKPYKTSGGKMVWNEELKREVPEGWEVVTIDEYAEVKKGELITAKDAKQGSIKVIAAGINFSYLHSTPNRKKNTITISGSGANAGFINFWREPIFASDCITVRGKSDAETLILLQYLHFIQPHILNQATGSAQPHVYPSDIKVLNYVVPPASLIENYGRAGIPMNEKIGTNLIQNQKLTEMRDWLLPMLMNGQVRVN
jgi:type I restriction enzyme S subunit